MSDDETLGQDIRALRHSRKMTLEELAKATGKSLGWVSQVERGLSIPTVDDLHRISRVLEVPMSMFLGVADASEDERGLIVRASKRREIGERDRWPLRDAALARPDR